MDSDSPSRWWLGWNSTVRGRSSYTFLCYHNQISISVSLPFSNARHGMGAGKCKEKSASRLNLATAAGLGQFRGCCEQGVDCLESLLLWLGEERNPLYTVCSCSPPCPKSCQRPFTSPLLLFVELLWMCVQASQARERDL